MIPMKMSVFLNGHPFTAAFNNLMRSPVKLSMLLSYKLHKIQATLVKENENFLALRQKLVEQYADKDSEGKPVVVENKWQFSDSNKELYDKGFQELINIEFQLPAKVSASEFPKDVEIISPPEFGVLSEMLSD